jgi:hypothetical protein
VTERIQELLAILRVAHETSSRGAGLSLGEALRRVHYGDRRANFGPADLRPLLVAHPDLSEAWLAYSEDKRTSGGWYLLRSGEIGRPRLAAGPLPERIAMSQILRFFGSMKRDPAITAWMNEHPGELGDIARHWFDVIRQCGDDVRELLHDGHPTACIADAAFAYVNAFRAHVNVGFFRGAEIEDPMGLLEGTGKYMRHVKLRPESDIDAAALVRLIESAYADMKRRLETV